MAGHRGVGRIDSKQAGLGVITTAAGAVVVSFAPVVAYVSVNNPDVQTIGVSVIVPAISAITKVIDPVVNLSAVILSIDSLSAIASVINPTVVLNESLNIAPVIFYSNIVSPQVVQSGVVVSVPALIAIADIVNPFVIIGKRQILKVGIISHGYDVKIKGMELN